MRFNTIARLMVAGAAIAGLTALTAPKANADILLNLIGAPTPSGPNFVYQYSVTLAPGTQISAGTATFSGGGTSLTQGFTMFDFFGLTGTPTFTASAGGANFVITTPSTGTQVPQGGVGNETAALNISAAYSGTPLAGGTQGLLLGNLFATSTVNVVINGANPFSATTVTTQTGFAATNQGSVDGPGIAPVPEAGTVSLLALGMAGMVGVVIRKRTK